MVCRNCWQIDSSEIDSVFELAHNIVFHVKVTIGSVRWDRVDTALRALSCVLMHLEPIDIEPASGPVTARVGHWIATASKRGKQLDCFDYIPSCPELLYGFLQVVPGRRYCEWGSGAGVGVGIASALGFDAVGIELDGELANLSRQLLNEHELKGEIITGSYFDLVVDADIVFTYCWPGQINAVQERFMSAMPRGRWLLIAQGAEWFTPMLNCSGDG